MGASGACEESWVLTRMGSLASDLWSLRVSMVRKQQANLSCLCGAEGVPECDAKVQTEVQGASLAC